MTAAVRKRDVFVGGAAFFAYFLSPPKESRFYKLKFSSTLESAIRRNTVHATDAAQISAA